jgi:hypothetical protein
MYRIRLYIVPEHDEDEREREFSSGFVDKDLLSSANGCWWDTVRGDGCVTVTHRSHKAKVKVTISDSQQHRDQIAGRCRNDRNNRVNTANKVCQICLPVELNTFECLVKVTFDQEWLHLCMGVKLGCLH